MTADSKQKGKVMTTNKPMLPAAPVVNAAARQEQIDRFNSQYPVGAAVTVVEDDRFTRTQTTTRIQAWLLGGHTPVVLLADRRGGYLLDRVGPPEPGS